MEHTREGHTRHLSRSTSDRMIGGVCGGLARYFGLDATLVRIGAVVLCFVTGGTAIWVYLAAWWLLPEDAWVDVEIGEPGDRSRRRAAWCMPWFFFPGQRHHRGRVSGHRHGTRNHPDASTIIGFALLAVAAMMVFSRLPFWDDELVWAIGLLAVGFGILWFGKAGNARTDDERWLAGGDDVTPTSVASEPAPEPEPEPADSNEPTDESPFEPVTPWYEIPIDRPTPPPPPTPPVPVPPPAPAASYAPARWVTPTVLGLLLVGGGVVGLLVAAGVDITPGQAFAGALMVVGGGLVGGAFSGRGRLLIVPGVVLFGLLSLSTLDIPFTAGIGETGCDGADGRCEHFIGEMVFDLSDAESGTYSARQGIGEMRVRVPEGAELDLDATVGVGHIEAFGDDRGGLRTELTRRFNDDGNSDTQPLRLDLDLGVGEIRIEEVARR